MTTSTIISMFLILTMVVGGFIYFLAKAVRKEKDRK